MAARVKLGCRLAVNNCVRKGRPLGCIWVMLVFAFIHRALRMHEPPAREWSLPSLETLS